MINDKLDIDIMFVLIDKGLLIENSTVFQSQVGDQLIALKSMGFKVGLITIYKNKKVFDNVIGNKLSNNNIYLNLLKDRNFFLLSLLLLGFKIRKLKKIFNINFFYCRGIWGSIALKLAFPLGKYKYTYDVRGDLEAEIKSIKINKLKKNIFLQLEKFSIQNASNVTAVSSHLANLIKKKYHIKVVNIIPCCISFNNYSANINLINKIMKRLRYNKDDIIFVYSGGLSHYQQVKQMLELWKLFLNDNRIKFLLLTNQDPHSHPITIDNVKNFGKKLIHLNVPHKKVHEYLFCSNIGFLLRENIALNNSASPVKFSEYLASGLSIISSPGIGDISDCILKNNLGVLIDTNNIKLAEKLIKYLINEIKNDKKVNLLKKNSIDIAKKIYNWNSYKNIYNKMYKSN